MNFDESSSYWKFKEFGDYILVRTDPSMASSKMGFLEHLPPPTPSTILPFPGRSDLWSQLYGSRVQLSGPTKSYSRCCTHHLKFLTIVDFEVDSSNIKFLRTFYDVTCKSRDFREFRGFLRSTLEP